MAHLQRLAELAEQSVVLALAMELAELELASLEQ